MTDLQIILKNGISVFVCEGSGDALTDEDIEDGYVDYMMLDSNDADDQYGACVLLTKLYQDFKSKKEVADYLLDNGWITEYERIIEINND